MAAEATSGGNSGRTNYYSISYGMLSTKRKEPLSDTDEEIKAEDLKARTMAVENIDLRSKYVKKEGDYPYQVFYSTIGGTIKNIEKDNYEKGISLRVTLEDVDGDESILQTKFYGKVAADFLNRLSGLGSLNRELYFSPYSIPSEFETPEGKKIKFYQSGVSIKDGGNKVARAFKVDGGLPKTEQVQNEEGKMVTSRVKQINWLWDKVSALSNNIETPTQKATPAPVAQDSGDDLPF